MSNKTSKIIEMDKRKVWYFSEKGLNTAAESFLVLMGWSLLHNALQPFKIYCVPLTIISQLVLFLWQTIKIDPLGEVRVVEALQNLVQKCDCMILSEFLIYIAGAES
jgi:hypothetical protein